MKRHRRVVVIGAGLAGLRAGWELARAGHEVTVLERKSAAGGRAGSAPDPETGEPVDTGQHALLGCYRETLRWFSDLGTRHLVAFQRRLDVLHLKAGGEEARFTAAPLPPPFNLLAGLGRVAPRAAGRAWLAGLVRGTLRGGFDDTMTVRAWEERAGIPQAVRDLVIEPLAIAALNETPDVASALPFAAVLRRLAWVGNRGAAVGFAVAGLGDTYVPAALKVIERSGGSVRRGAWAARILAADGIARGVRLADGAALEADGVVAAVPPWDLGPLGEGLPELAGLREAAGRLQPSPIVTVHLWLDRSVHPGWFAGMLEGRFQWLFNRTAIVGGGREGTEHLCLVKSGARDLLGMKPDALGDLAAAELRRFVPAAAHAGVVRTRVVWETKATVSLAPGTDALRPSAVMAMPGLALAGDWIQTGLPATIEGAVKSGGMAARALLASFR